MMLNNINDIEKFKNIVSKCTGDVWFESKYGDKFNLKSELSQYVAISALITDKYEDLELFAQLPEDEAILFEILENFD